MPLCCALANQSSGESRLLFRWRQCFGMGWYLCVTLSCMIWVQLYTSVPSRLLNLTLNHAVRTHHDPPASPFSEAQTCTEQRPLRPPQCHQAPGPLACFCFNSYSCHQESSGYQLTCWIWDQNLQKGLGHQKNTDCKDNAPHLFSYIQISHSASETDEHSFAFSNSFLRLL